MSDSETKPEVTEGHIIQHHIIQAQELLADQSCSSFAGPEGVAPPGPDKPAAPITKEE